MAEATDTLQGSSGSIASSVLVPVIPRTSSGLPTQRTRQRSPTRSHAETIRSSAPTMTALSAANAVVLAVTAPLLTDHTDLGR